MPTDISETHAREWLMIFTDGRTWCGANELGVWYHDINRSTHLVSWSKVERDLYEDNLREHCRAAADQERDIEEEEA